MKHGVLRLLCALVMVLGGFAALTAGTRYRVSDETLTFYSDPDRFNRLGQMHRGDEFEAIGMDGTLLIFEYKGRKAYIASYCCKEIAEEPAPAAAKAPVKAETAANPEPDGAEPGDVSAGDEAVRATPAPVDPATGRYDFRKADLPEWLASLLALYFLAGIGVGFWVLFGHGSCERFFDNLADGYVTRCKTLTYFRPLVAVVIWGLTLNMTLNMTAALAVAGVYELILLTVRSRKLGSFREAAVEALYLSLRGIGAVALCAIFIILAFVAAGGPGSSGSEKKEGSRPAECRDCRHYCLQSTHCEKGYLQDGTCTDFSAR